MRIAILPVTILLLMIFNFKESKQNKICYSARTCIHDGQEKCGRDHKGKLRRFYDSCDLLEYNCLYKTEFVKVSMSKCNGLPPIDNEKPKELKS